MARASARSTQIERQLKNAFESEVLDGLIAREDRHTVVLRLRLSLTGLSLTGASA